MTDTRLEARRRGSLALLSNDALIELLNTVFDAYDAAGRPPAIEARLNAIHREIACREYAGTLTERDWLL